MVAPNQIVLLLVRIIYNHSENTTQHTNINGDGVGGLGMGQNDKELSNPCSIEGYRCALVQSAQM